MQGKSRLLFTAPVWLACGLCPGCHSGPVFIDDAAYRAIEREADRSSIDLAITGTDIASGIERAGGQTARIKSELDNLGEAIGGSGLEDSEKGILLHRVSAAQNETAALSREVAVLRKDAGRLNEQLAEEREIRAALSEEHDRREADGAAVKAELEGKKEELAKVKGQRNLCLVIFIAAGLGILGCAAFRVRKFFTVSP